MNLSQLKMTLKFVNSILEDKELLAEKQDAEYDMKSAQSSIKTAREALESGN